MFERVRQLLEMVRFSHTIFALPFAMLAAVMAWTVPAPSGETVPFRWQHIVGILVCMVTARNSAMAFNRLADRHIDATNPRTSGRHLPAGTLSVQSVVVFTIVNAIGFVAATLLFVPNWLPLYFAIPVLGVLLIYSLTKRFTSLAHFWLGLSLMLAPICTWIALRGEWLIDEPLDALPALLLGGAVLAWVAGFDMIYACQDVDVDVRSKLHSVPAAIGIRGALRLALGCHVVMLVILAAIPLLCTQLPFGVIYWTGIAIVACLILYQHWLVRPDDLTRVNLAFFHVNAVISVGLFVVGTVDALL